MIGADDFSVFYSADDFGCELLLTHVDLSDKKITVLFEKCVDDSAARTNGRSSSKPVKFDRKTARIPKVSLPNNYSEYSVVIDGDPWVISTHTELSVTEYLIYLVPEVVGDGVWVRD